MDSGLWDTQTGPPAGGHLLGLPQDPPLSPAWPFSLQGQVQGQWARPLPGPQGQGPGQARQGRGAGMGKPGRPDRERLVSAGAAGCQVHILSAACTASAFITAELGGFISARAWRHLRARPLPALRWAR